MSNVTSITSTTFKAKLLVFTYDNQGTDEELKEELAEILSFSEERCREEFLKIQNILGFKAELLDFIDGGGDIASMDKMPLIQAQQKEQDFLVAENAQENIIKRRAQFKLV